MSITSDNAFIRFQAKGRRPLGTATQPVTLPTSDDLPAQMNSAMVGRMTQADDGGILRIERPPALGEQAIAMPHLQFSDAVLPPDWKPEEESGNEESLSSLLVFSLTTPLVGFERDPASVADAVSDRIEAVSDRIEAVSACDEAVNACDEAMCPAPVDGGSEEAGMATSESTSSDPRLDESGGRAALQPAWEVDRLLWPARCQRLYELQSEPFRQAGEQLRAASAEGLRVLAVTSAFRREGRTHLAMCLARSAAAAGLRVALVDVDLEQPGMAHALRMKPSSGWSQVLLEEQPLGEAAILAIEDGITMFPLATGASEALELDDLRVAEFIRALSEHYDLVILDMPPMADREEFVSVEQGNPINATIVVRDVRSTAANHVSSVVDRLFQTGVEAVGIAENFTS
jgi:Mrp family chromosome partitioning ATPase